MTTLYKRANPTQKRILKIIEGSVLNTHDAHNMKRDMKLARSIAKRAAGTISAQWPELLAVNSRLSEKGTISSYKCRACERREYLKRKESCRERTIVSLGDVTLLDGKAQRGSSHLVRRSPLLILWHRLKMNLWHLKKEGNLSKAEAYIDLLRMIDKLHRSLIAQDSELHV
jgi:hypothetical protein